MTSAEATGADERKNPSRLLRGYHPQPILPETTTTVKEAQGRTSFRTGAWILVATLAVPAGARAQTPVPSSLSLEEAVQIALNNNPSHLASRNDAEVADWDVRAAYGSWAPSVSANSSFSWQGPGEQRFGSLTTEELGFGNQPSYYFSTYSLGMSYTVNGATLLAPGQARARQEATGARIRSSAATLEQTVTGAYLEVLRQEEALRLAQQQLARAEANARLATAQRDVGSVTQLDVSRAEVEVGRARVEVLRAENAVNTARVALHRQLGFAPDDQGPRVELTTEFELLEPTWTAEGLFGEALRHNPVLAELEASRVAADYQVRTARSAYYPSLSLQAGLSGFAREASDLSSVIGQAQAQAQAQIQQCQTLNELFTRLADPLPAQDCSQFALSQERVDAIRESNDAFPFDFTRQPAQASVAISIPIFQGLSRQRDLEAAEVERQDARYRIRDQELALRADIASGLAAVETAYRSAMIEAENQEVADEQLRLAREQYRVGQISFIDLAEAETVKAQADRERIAALYAYHDALANLEAIVGRSLRDDGNEE